LTSGGVYPARLLPPLRTGVFLIAGSIRYSFVRFLIADAIYGVVGVGLIFFGGTGLLALMHQLGDWALFAVGGAAVLVGQFFFYRYLRRLELKAATRVADAVAQVVAPEEAPRSMRHAGA
jgi:membrane protein DedA with SNARE-associated domain